VITYPLKREKEKHRLKSAGLKADMSPVEEAITFFGIKQNQVSNEKRAPWLVRLFFGMKSYPINIAIY